MVLANECAEDMRDLHIGTWVFPSNEQNSSRSFRSPDSASMAESCLLPSKRKITQFVFQQNLPLILHLPIGPNMFAIIPFGSVTDWPYCDHCTLFAAFHLAYKSALLSHQWNQSNYQELLLFDGWFQHKSSDVLGWAIGVFNKFFWPIHLKNVVNIIMLTSRTDLPNCSTRSLYLHG